MRDRRILPLDSNTAATLRMETEPLTDDQAWSITRIVEQAAADAYEQGFIRGWSEARDRSAASERKAKAELAKALGTAPEEDPNRG